MLPGICHQLKLCWGGGVSDGTNAYEVTHDGCPQGTGFRNNGALSPLGWGLPRLPESLLPAGHSWLPACGPRGL